MSRPLFLLPVVMLAGLYGLSPSAAQENAETAPDLESLPHAELGPTAREAGDDLETITGEIRLSEERINQIRAEIEALEGDTARLAAELVATGQRVDLAGEDVRLIEERLEELFASERAIRSRLDGHDRSISNLLASLQRISASPPPAMIVDPTDALASARAALLLSAVLPELQDKARTVTQDLNALLALKQTALTEADRLNANIETLHAERLRIATVIEARNQGREWLSEELLVEEAEARALADRATSLEQLIAGLETRIAALTAADEARSAASSGSDVPVLDPETLAIAFADATRTEPAVPLEAARGFLTRPANGVAVQSFGAADGFGGTAQGLTLATRADAPVLAPADGWVAYAGPFLNYGQILVLNAGQDYMIVLAGLGVVDVELGDFVTMGTPVGTMGGRAEGLRLAGNAGVAGPTLYIELREGGIPINPQGWWAARSENEESEQG
ncbi:murein hydrolase activator EnvC family protein [Pelagibacterium sediminicola]|uniref:murein hydrolase activator EnvC family protein n=1 Tax=Pelagibacterium sediminicola TaxID=2248761 RepID=UPI001300B93D|nr:peptidoglycan DD-metalloendopeptidase family protein [Pelagibacterium sediminicola]